MAAGGPARDALGALRLLEVVRRAADGDLAAIRDDRCRHAGPRKPPAVVQREGHIVGEPPVVQRDRAACHSVSRDRLSRLGLARPLPQLVILVIVLLTYLLPDRVPRAA